jgi:hypothetical protein
MSRWTDAPIVGGAYSDETVSWDRQDTVNFIPVRTERPGGRSEWKLVSAPGFYQVADTGSNAPIRGMRNVEGTLLVVSGTTLYKVGTNFSVTAIGTIPGVLRVKMAHNQIAGGNEVAIPNGQSGYVYNTVSNTLVQITDEAFPGALTFDFVDGYITGIDPGRNYAFTSDLAAATSYNSLDRYQAEGSPDKLVGQSVDHREWWLFGERTIEPYQNTGQSTGTFQRSGGTVIDVGAASPYAIVKLDNSTFWLGSDGIVYRANGYSPVRISTFPIEQAIARSNMSTAFAFTFEDRGHKIFYLTFQDGQTWGYDVATQEWHRRESRGLGRWRINDLVQWNGMWIAGDFSNGRLYRLDWDVMHEDGEIMERRRVTGVLHDSQNAVIVNAIALVMDTGRPAVDAPLTIYGNAPNAAVDTDYTYSGYRVVGGVKPYTITIVAGALPPGLTLAPSGLAITGVPTDDGVYSFTLQAVDARGKVARLADSITVFESQIITPTATYRFKQVANGDPADYSAPDYDDSSWGVGQTPAASQVPHPYAGTQGWPQVKNTEWNLNTSMWLRASFDMTMVNDLVFEVFVDNYATVWCNGIKILNRAGTIDTPSGPVFNHVVPIPASMLHTGMNSIVVLGEDFGVYSYLACRMSVAL